MAKFNELQQAYLQRMNKLLELQKVLHPNLYSEQVMAWKTVKTLANQTHFREWVAANSQAFQAYEQAFEEHQAQYNALSDEEGEEAIYCDDYYVTIPTYAAFGYREPEWPKF